MGVLEAPRTSRITPLPFSAVCFRAVLSHARPAIAGLNVPDNTSPQFHAGGRPGGLGDFGRSNLAPFPKSVFNGFPARVAGV